MSRIKGWCPGALKPMESGDGWIMRIKPRAGCLEAAQSLAIASAAARHGNGLIDLTGRANLQIRGLCETAFPALLRDLGDAGLIDADIATETRRNILLSPFARSRAIKLAQDLEHALAASDLTLPAKFGFAIDCADMRVLNDSPADIRIELGLHGGLILRADGCEFGAEFAGAHQALELAAWFVDQGGIRDGRGRMKSLIKTGACPPQDHRIPPVPAGPSVRPGMTPHGRLIALEFGQCNAQTLARLGAAGPLRVTPWRMLLIPGDDMPDLHGLIHEPDDPRLRIHACSGAPRCPQALASTRPLARELAAHLPANVNLHVSGCGKGCGWPRRADLTLTATGPGRFDLIRGGIATDPAERRDLTPDTIRKAL